MFYIRDCNDIIMGNPKGYRTMRGAMHQAESKKSKIHRELWARFYAKKKENPESTFVYSVK